MADEQASEPMNLKWSAPKDPLEIEATLKQITPLPKVFEKMYNEWYVRYRQENPQIEIIKAQKEEKKAIRAIEQGYALEFQNWLRGESYYNAAMDSVTGKNLLTPWGSQSLLFLPDVKEYISEFIRKKAQYQFKLAQLYMIGPRTLDEAYIYFKYIVSGEQLQPGQMDFLVEYDRFFPNSPQFAKLTDDGKDPMKSAHDIAEENLQEKTKYDAATAAFAATPVLSTGAQAALLNPTLSGMNIVLQAFRDQSDAVVKALADVKLQAPALPAELLALFQQTNALLNQGNINTATINNQLAWNHSNLGNMLTVLYNQNKGSTGQITDILNSINTHASNLTPILAAVNQLPPQIANLIEETKKKQKITVKAGDVHVPQPVANVTVTPQQQPFQFDYIALTNAIKQGIPQQPAPVVQSPTVNLDHNALAQALAANMPQQQQAAPMDVDALANAIARVMPQQQAPVVNQGPTTVNLDHNALAQAIAANMPQQAAPVVNQGPTTVNLDSKAVAQALAAHMPQQQQAAPFDYERLEKLIQSIKPAQPVQQNIQPIVAIPGLQDVVSSLKQFPNEMKSLLDSHARVITDSIKSLPKDQQLDQLTGILGQSRQEFLNILSSTIETNNKKLTEFHMQAMNQLGTTNKTTESLLKSVEATTTAFNELHKNTIMSKDAQLAQVSKVADFNHNRFLDSQASIAALQAHFDKLTKTGQADANMIAELKSAVMGLKTEHKSMTSDHTELTKTLNTLSGEKAKLREELTAAQNTIKELRTTVANNADAGNNLNARVTEAEATIARYVGLEQQYDELLKKHNQSNLDINTLQTKLAAMDASSSTKIEELQKAASAEREMYENMLQLNRKTYAQLAEEKLRVEQSLAEMAKAPEADLVLDKPVLATEATGIKEANEFVKNQPVVKAETPQKAFVPAPVAKLDVSAYQGMKFDFGGPDEGAIARQAYEKMLSGASSILSSEQFAEMKSSLDKLTKSNSLTNERFLEIANKAYQQAVRHSVQAQRIKSLKERTIDEETGVRVRHIVERLGKMEQRQTTESISRITAGIVKAFEGNQELSKEEVAEIAPAIETMTATLNSDNPIPEALADTTATLQQIAKAKGQAFLQRVISLLLAPDVSKDKGDAELISTIKSAPKKAKENYINSAGRERYDQLKSVSVKDSRKARNQAVVDFRKAAQEALLTKKRERPMEDVKMQSGTGIADMVPMDTSASGVLVEGVGASGGSNNWEASGDIVPEHIVNKPRAEEAQREKNSEIYKQAQEARGEIIPRSRSKKKYNPTWFEEAPPGK